MAAVGWSGECYPVRMATHCGSVEGGPLSPRRHPSGDRATQSGRCAVETVSRRTLASAVAAPCGSHRADSPVGRVSRIELIPPTARPTASDGRSGDIHARSPRGKPAGPPKRRFVSGRMVDVTGKRLGWRKCQPIVAGADRQSARQPRRMARVRTRGRADGVKRPGSREYPRGDSTAVVECATMCAGNRTARRPPSGVGRLTPTEG